MDHTDEFSLRDALTVLFRHGRAILLVTIVSVATAGLYLAVTPKLYTAVTRVLVGLGREKFEDLGMQTQPVGNLVFQERAQNINNEVEILRDTALILHALPALKARLALSPRAQKISPLAAWRQRFGDMMVDVGIAKRRDPDVALELKLYKALNVTAVKETDVIDVTFTWDDPVFAADALNIYLSEYNKQHLQVYEIKRSVAFFRDQLAKAQKDLADVENTQSGFMHAGGVSNFDAEKTQQLSELASLRQEAAGARLDRDTAQMKLNAVGAQFQAGGWIETPDAADAAEGSQALDQSFVQLLDQRTRLLARFEPEAEPVRDIDRQIARLRSQKAQALTAFYRGRVAALAGKVSQLDSQIAEHEHALRSLTDRTSDFDSIQRRRTAAAALVEEYRRKLEELQVSSELNASAFSSVRVLSEATPPVLPSFPKPALLLGLAFAFGLLAGVAYAVVSEFLTRTFRQPSQVVRVLRLPVLATVPDLG